MVQHPGYRIQSNGSGRSLSIDGGKTRPNKPVGYMRRSGLIPAIGGIQVARDAGTGRFGSKQGEAAEQK